MPDAESETVRPRPIDVDDSIVSCTAVRRGARVHHHVIDADEPLLIHPGVAASVDAAAAALERAIPLTRIAWLHPGGEDPAARAAISAWASWVPAARSLDPPDADHSPIELGGRRVSCWRLPTTDGGTATVLYEHVTGTLFGGRFGANRVPGERWLTAGSDDDTARTLLRDLRSTLDEHALATLRQLVALGSTRMLVSHGACWLGDVPASVMATS